MIAAVVVVVVAIFLFLLSFASSKYAKHRCVPLILEHASMHYGQSATSCRSRQQHKREEKKKPNGNEL